MLEGMKWNVWYKKECCTANMERGELSLLALRTTTIVVLQPTPGRTGTDPCLKFWRDAARQCRKYWIRWVNGIRQLSFRLIFLLYLTC